MHPWLERPRSRLGTQARRTPQASQRRQILHSGDSHPEVIHSYDPGHHGRSERVCRMPRPVLPDPGHWTHPGGPGRDIGGGQHSIAPTTGGQGPWGDNAHGHPTRADDLIGRPVSVIAASSLLGLGVGNKGPAHQTGRHRTVDRHHQPFPGPVDRTVSLVHPRSPEDAITGRDDAITGR